MTSALRGGGAKADNSADRFHELYSDKGDGLQNPKNLADIINRIPLTEMPEAVR